MEHWERLCPGGLRFVYDDALFRPGTDTFLLSSLPRLKPGLRVMDLGCGTGLLALLLLQRQPELTVSGLDIQPEAICLANEAAAENRLTERLSFFHGDLRGVRELFPAGGFDLVVCNPPYGKQNGTLKSQTETVSLARHEQDTSIGEIVKSAGALLRTMGRLTMVFPAQRFLELCDELRRCRLEPKRVRMVCAKLEKPPYLVLVESMKNARPGLHWMPPLVVYDPQGRETAEIERIYHKG